MSLLKYTKDDPDLVHDLNNGVIEIQDNRSYTKEFKLNRFKVIKITLQSDAI